jgi:hypothetical protein
MKILISCSKNNTIGQSMIVAFRSLGHDSRLFFDDHSLIFYIFSFLTNSPFRKKAFSYLYRHKLNIGKQLLAAVHAYKPDLVLVIQGDYFLKNTIEQVKEKSGILVFNWLVRDPVLVEFYDPFRIANLSGYSSVFIADKLWQITVSYIFSGEINYLPLAGNNFVYSNIVQKRDIDCLFVGDLLPSSPSMTSGWVHARVLDWLAESGFRLTVAARNLRSMRKIFPNLKKVQILPFPKKLSLLNKLYNRAKIVLSLISLDLKKDFSDPIFNVALTKTFQLVEYKESMQVSGLVQFKSLNELNELLQKYLSDDEARNHSAMRFWEWTSTNNTYRHRAQSILNFVNL